MSAADVGPNITGQISNIASYDESSGSFALTQTNGVHHDGGGARRYKVDFSASRSVNLYGRSSTVQPAALRFLPCIKV